MLRFRRYIALGTLLALLTTQGASPLVVEPEHYLAAPSPLQETIHFPFPTENINPSGFSRNEGVALMTLGVSVLLGSLILFSSVLDPLATGSYFAGIFNAILFPTSILMLVYPLAFLLLSLANLIYPPNVFKNSFYFSFFPKAMPPGGKWPPVTIQIPVYLESFDTVIRPTLESALAAAQNYRARGGKANIVVHDDGLLKLADDNLTLLEEKISQKIQCGQLLSNVEAEVQKRLVFYRENKTGFTARSTEGRRGLFKKASNMNFGMRLSDLVAQEIEEARLDSENPAQQKEALARVIRRQNLPCHAEGDISLGEFIVLLDKDSVIPEDAIAKTIPEYVLEPRLGFTQHKTRPINEDENYFSRMVGRFTQNLFQLIFVFSTQGGSPSPLVGHNAILRMKALREAGFVEGGVFKYWSEDRVSEDFDLSMRLQTKDYFGRYIAYPDTDFGEGVTRTFQEEIQKLTKFAYGASEMMLNPVKQWFQKGLFTKTFKEYIFSRQITWYTKLHLCFYLSSYFAIALIPVKFLVNVGFIVAGFYLQTIATTTYMILVQSVLIFSFVGPISLFVMRMRLYSHPLFGMKNKNKLEEAKRDIGFALMYLLFFAGVPFGIFKGVASHLFEIRREWGATNMDKLGCEPLKEIVKKIWAQDKLQFVLASVFSLILFVSLLSSPSSFLLLLAVTLVFSLGHLVVPFLLNPVFMGALCKSTRGKIHAAQPQPIFSPSSRNKPSLDPNIRQIFTLPLFEAAL